MSRDRADYSMSQMSDEVWDVSLQECGPLLFELPTGRLINLRQITTVMPYATGMRSLRLACGKELGITDEDWAAIQAEISKRRWV